MASTQELTRRIKSIKNTRKITKAMQLVSASKMRKSQQAMYNSRKYQTLAERMYKEVIHSVPKEQIPQVLFRLTATPEEIAPRSKQRILLIVLSTNKGLVGGFNANLLRSVLEFEAVHADKQIDYAPVGKKAAEALRGLNKNITAVYRKYDIQPALSEIYQIAYMSAREYENGVYDAIYLAYNNFVSSIQQSPVVEQMLPLPQNLRPDEEIVQEKIIEPGTNIVLERIVIRLLESIILKAYLETDAAEHAARMLMMKNATDAAGDIIHTLTLTYNQIRQSKITTELSEIIAGKLALEKNQS